MLVLSLFPDFSETLGQLLEWSPLVLVHESCLSTCLELGIYLDGVLAHSPPPSCPFPVVPVAHDPVAEACAWLFHKGHQAVHVLSDTNPEGLHHFLSQYNQQPLQVIAFNQQAKGTYYPQFYQKWLPKGALLHFYHEHLNEISGCTAAGHSYLYEVPHDGMVTLKGTQPFSVLEFYQL